MIGYLAGAVVGALLFFAIYPESFKFIIGEGVFFKIGDAPLHVSGWLFYAKDDWHWPLLKTRMIAPPEGINIALADSIPLAALLFKSIYPFFWDNFHYFGMWHMFAFITQGLGAVFLIRGLGHKGLLAAITAATLALLWPALLARFQHTALMTHGLLLFSLGIYFRHVDTVYSITRSRIFFSVCIIASLLVHPYLFVMTFGIFLAAIHDRGAEAGTWYRKGATLAWVCGSTLLTALVLGYASVAGQTDGGGGHAHFSMNLLAPFCGGSLSLCSEQDATGGQYEGFNYLGMGSFLFVVVALGLGASRWRAAVDWIQAHCGLSLVLLGLTLYALSEQIFVGGYHLTHIPYPYPYERLADTFRASGRFFWPVGYTLTFLAMATVLKRHHVAIGAVAMIALMLQWLDTQSLREKIQAALTLPAPVDYSPWKNFHSEIDNVIVYPEYGCDSNIENMRYVYFQVVAARSDATINSSYLARSSRICNKENPRYDELPRGTLVVDFSPLSQIDDPAAEREIELQDGCWQWSEWGGLVMCMAGASDDKWEELGLL